MYLGEGRLYQERVREFIKVAQDLEVKEISEGLELPIEEAQTTLDMNITEDNYEEDLNEETSAEDLPGEDIKEAPIQPKSLISSDSKSFKCPVCGEEYSDGGLMFRHYKSTHKAKSKAPCDQCDYQAKNRQHLLKHIKSVHEGVRYPCDQCDYQASAPYNLQRHIQSIHEGIKYPCNQCDYKATQRGSLQKHIQCKHGGKKIPLQTTRQPSDSLE